MKLLPNESQQNYLLPESESLSIGQQIIDDYKPEVFPDPKGSLRAFYVIGQPASGKTLLRNHLLEVHHINSNTIICNTDDLRTYHPAYNELLKDPTGAPNLVNQDAYKWVNRLFDFALTNKYHVLIDATFGSTDMQHYAKQLERLKAAGYIVSINSLCVHPEISYMSNYDRYLKSLKTGMKERLITKKLHEASVKNLPVNLIKTADTLGHLVDEVCAFKRSDFKIVPHGPLLKDITELVSVISLEHQRPLSLEERKKMKEMVKAISLQLATYAPTEIHDLFRNEFATYLARVRKPKLIH